MCSNMVINLLAALYPIEYLDADKQQTLKEEIPLRVQALVAKVPSQLPFDMLQSYLLQYGKRVLQEIDEDDM